jgi:hypothetical protein
MSMSSANPASYICCQCRRPARYRVGKRWFCVAHTPSNGEIVGLITGPVKLPKQPEPAASLRIYRGPKS